MLFFLIISIFLVWCTKQVDDLNNYSKLNKEEKCIEYKVDDFKIEKIYRWKVFSEDYNVLSTRAWIVLTSFKTWDRVKKGDLLLTIFPDRNDINVLVALKQKEILDVQKQNLDEIYNIYIEQLNNQKENIKKQIDLLDEQKSILGKNLENLLYQSKISTSEIDIQINTQKKNLEDLKILRENLLNAKKNEIEKIDVNLKNLKNIINDNIDLIFKRVDEVFWITTQNILRSNDIRPYISAKNENLKNRVINEYNLDRTNINLVLQYLDLVLEAIKNSISSIYLSQTLIDSLYNEFYNYKINLLNQKNNLENIEKNLKSLELNYDNQILNIDTQIKQIENNIINLKDNKLKNIDFNTDIQINQIKQSILNIDNNLYNLKLQLQNIENQINNQKLTIENQKKQIDLQYVQLEEILKPIYIYSDKEWFLKFIVKNWERVNNWQLIAKISYDTYVEVYLSELDDFNLTWCKNKKLLEYKDTNWNYIMRFDECNYIENDNLEIKVSKILTWVWVPYDYIFNSLTWNYIKLKTWLVEVKLWDRYLDRIQILSWLLRWDVICK